MKKEISVFGHKNPDTDSIASAISMANLRNQLGELAKGYRLGNVNKETNFALQTFKFDAPELMEKVEEKSSVIMVDTNEFSQVADGIENANIKMIVDHHRINIQTNDPIYYLAEPVGCTATILYKLYKQYDVTIDQNIAGLMLSAIISDTLLFKSPTCTEEDKIVAKKLSDIANVDLSRYGMDMLKAGTDISDFTPEQVINIDCKPFEKDGKKFKIAQINTADVADVFKKQAYFEQAINNEIKNDNLDLYVFAVTDILNSSSRVITMGNKSEVVEKAFGVTLDNHTATLENVVSRKKQILPNILNNLE